MKSSDKLADMGIILKDTREGVQWKASLSYLKELFALGNTDIKTYSPLTLAYIGDAVYEIVIRTNFGRKRQCTSQ